MAIIHGPLGNLDVVPGVIPFLVGLDVAATPSFVLVGERRGSTLAPEGRELGQAPAARQVVREAPGRGGVLDGSGNL